jgi:4-hydroxythreonine-4-phosphate dehydrogenase
MGDPVGIGPEVIVKAASVPDVRDEADIIVVGDPNVLDHARRDTSIRLQIVEVSTAAEAAARQGTWALPVLPLSRIEGLRWSHPTEESDAAQGKYIERAFELVMRGEATSIVTAPISKASMNRAGATWTGHTEMLAELSTKHVPRSDGRSWTPVMLIAGPTLKVVPLTTHVRLADAARLVTKDRVLHALRVTYESFRQHFGRQRPRIAVAGVNPHAGEGGLFGDEERSAIQPAIQEARALGIEVAGPFSADTIFHRAVSGEFDVVIGMYHDQALIPIKLLDFDRAVNVTLGLPVSRTSVDHGTAYDIAGRGIASANSMIEALRLAARMASAKSRTKEAAIGA